MLLPPALGFEVIPSRFTNSGVKPVDANMHSVFEYLTNCERKL